MLEVALLICSFEVICYLINGTHTHKDVSNKLLASSIHHSVISVNGTHTHSVMHGVKCLTKLVIIFFNFYELLVYCISSVLSVNKPPERRGHAMAHNSPMMKH